MALKQASTALYLEEYIDMRNTLEDLHYEQIFKGLLTNVGRPILSLLNRITDQTSIYTVFILYYSPTGQ